MNDNLEKELNEIESVEKQNQEHLKNIDSKVDELNELVNNINGKNIITNKNVSSNNNVVVNSNNTIQIQTQKEKTVIDLKKEIFDNRKLIRWTSFFSILSTLFLIGTIILWFYTFYQIKDFENKYHTGYFWTFLNIDCNFKLLFDITINLLWCSFIFNIIFLVKNKVCRNIYIPFFIFSFILPFLTWLYCMGLISFMKHKNKTNYYKWLKQTKIGKIENKYCNKMI